MKYVLIMLSILIFSACSINNKNFDKLFDGNNWEAVNKMGSNDEKNK